MTFRAPQITPGRRTSQYSTGINDLQNAILPTLPATQLGAVRAPQITPTRLPSQYVTDVLLNPVAIKVVPGTEALCIQRDPNPDFFRLKVQYLPDVGINPVAINVAPGTEVLCIERQFQPDFFRLKQQYVPDVAINPVALAAGSSRPFIPVIFDVVRRPQQYVPDVVINTTINIQPVAPIAKLVDTPRSVKTQYIPDVILNPVSLAQPPPFAPWLTEVSRVGRQSVPDGLSNPVALGVSPGTEVLIERQFQPDFFRPKSPYIPDVLDNPILPTGGPFEPQIFDVQKPPRQYVVEALLNPIIPRQSAVPFTPSLFDASKSSRQYVADSFLNRIVLGAAVIPAPFIPALFADSPRPSRQSRADVGANAVIPLQASVPFTSVGTSITDYAVRRQYVPEVITYFPALRAPVAAVPFVPPSLPDGCRQARQYVPDAQTNALPAAAPFVPYNFDAPRAVRQYQPEVFSTPAVLTEFPFRPELFYDRRTGKQFIPDVVVNSALEETAPFVPYIFDALRSPKQSAVDAPLNIIAELSGGPPQAPFVPVAFELAAKTRQYVTDLIPNATFRALAAPYVNPAYVAQYPQPIRIVQYPQPIRIVAAGMPRAEEDFTPIYTTEQVPIGFDFSKSLAIGETLENPVVSILLVYGTDPSPSSRLIGAPSIVGAFVTQWVGAELPGATYNYIATVQTSAGQILTTSAHQHCVAIS